MPRVPRILDATATECLVSARAPLDHEAAAALGDLGPIPGTLRAAPVVAPDHRLHAALRPLLQNADVLEPIDTDAHAWLIEAPITRGKVVVDPTGRPLDADGADLRSYPTIVREQVLWLEDANGVPTASVDRLMDWLDAFTRGARNERVRLRDPHGTLRPDTLRPLLEHRVAPQITLVLEDARGLALATAHAALRGPTGPIVRTTLLGIGPRTGHPATELLTADGSSLHPLAERAALIAHEPIQPRHPLWGSRRAEVLEPERLRTAQDLDAARWTPATLPVLLAHHLKAFGLEDDPETVRRLARLLAARLRPGERLDGPTLYAFLATHHDLAGAARRTEETR